MESLYLIEVGNNTRIRFRLAFSDVKVADLVTRNLYTGDIFEYVTFDKIAYLFFFTTEGMNCI